MPVYQKIELTPEAARIVAGMQTLPARIVNYIAAAMDQENLATASHIQSEHLTGKGPFPVAEHKLGVRSGLLRESVTASKAAIEGGLIVSAIGSNVKYAKIHEFGGIIHKPARQQKIRHRTDRRGNLLKRDNGLLIFAKAKHKNAREMAVEIPAHDVQMPERAPFRTGITECAGNYNRAISQHIMDAWKGLR